MPISTLRYASYPKLHSSRNASWVAKSHRPRCALKRRGGADKDATDEATCAIEAVRVIGSACSKE